MKILVTGGAGFIGSVLVPMALEEGHDVVVVDAGWWGYEHLPRGRGLHIVAADMRSIAKDYRPHPGEFQAVIHLAGMSNDPTANWNPELNWDLNYIGTMRLAKWCDVHNARLIYASTHSIYGLPDKVATEEMEGIAEGPYPFSKREAEAHVRDVYGTVLRLGTVHGVSPRMRYDLMVNTFAAACFKGEIRLDGGGASWRPVLDVRDAARAFLWAAAAPADTVAGEVFNIAHTNMRVSRVAQLIADAYEYRYKESVHFKDLPPRKEPRSQQISMIKSYSAGFEPVHGLTSCFSDLLQLTAAVNPDEDRFHNIRWLETKLAGLVGGRDDGHDRRDDQDDGGLELLADVDVEGQ